MHRIFKFLDIKKGSEYLLATLVFLAIIFSVVFVFPLPIKAQQSGDIVINKIDFEDYPEVNIYINFKEGSELGYLDLKQEDFVVLENGQEVSGLSVKPMDEISEPIGIALAIDTSGSMKGDPLSDAAGAASFFINEMRKIDKIAVVGFSDGVIVHSDFTSDHRKLRDSISGIEARGETALFDGIYEACELFRSGYNIKHKYLIVLSDGMDTASSHTSEEVIGIALKEDVVVYSVALLSPDFNPESIKRISEGTGGEMLATADSGELKELYEKISKKIINQYRISYTSLWPADENIKISLDIEKLDISESAAMNYENPYYAPPLRKIMFDYKNYFLLALFDIWWVKIIIYSAVFIAVTFFIYAMVLFMPVRRRTLKDKAGQYGFGTERTKAEEASGYEEEPERRGFIGWILRIVSGIASRRGFIELFESRLERAGMRIRASEFIAIHLFVMVATGMIVYFFSKNLILTAVVIILLALAPFLILNIKTSQRLSKFHEQLPDALQLISGSLKSGYSFNQALTMVVDESKPPLSEEFRRILSEIRMGIPEKEALENLSVRIKSEYFEWTVMAINVQREVGGNLAEVMETISTTIRERDRIMNKIKALTSEGKLSAIILIALPIVLGILLMIISREYISLLFSTKAGLLMLLVSGILMITGIIWILKIIQVKY
jgi:tight adherence protein B